MSLKDAVENLLGLQNFTLGLISNLYNNQTNTPSSIAVVKKIFFGSIPISCAFDLTAHPPKSWGIYWDRIH
jgi:hypothetical protein